VVRIRRSRLRATLVIGLVLGLVPGGPAAAQTVTVATSERVLGSIVHEQIVVRLADGALARGNVVRYPQADPGIELRPLLARGTVAGLQRFDAMATAEVRRGAVVGTNGGYWLPRPQGAPNGLHIESGRLLAGDASGLLGNHSPRGMLGIHPGGRLVMDRLRTTLALDLPDGPFPGGGPLNEINRQVRSEFDPTSPIAGELLLYDDRYGTAIQVPAGGIVAVVDGLGVGSSGRTEGAVLNVRTVLEPTAVQVPTGRHLVVAYGSRLPALQGLQVGARAGVTTTIAPYNSPVTDWDGLSGGLAGGQLLVQNGAKRTLAEWRTQNFGESHITGRQPRTAVGRSADGRGLLVTIDGRQTGWSVGMTVAELAATMLALGAVDALNLDGGGSTTMTIGGAIRNRPSELGRSVASGLFVYVAPPARPRSLDLACPPGVVPTARFSDTAGSTHGTAIDCLAWWRITTGLTATTFGPTNVVTRAQMASFLARWLDDLAARGTGRALPASAPLRFDDVRSSSPHAQAIARLADVGIITGRSSTTYQPDAPVSRAQTASLLRKAFEYSTASTLPAGRDTFIDDNTSVHEANIDALAGVRLIAGTSGFTFSPSASVTRGAMASLVMRASALTVERGVVAPPA
jgi:hypothetical protein